MAKRRNLGTGEKASEELTSDERRAQHKRERKDSPKSRAQGRSTRLYGLAIGGGIGAAVVAIIVVLVVFAQPHPCLSFDTPPGYPTFPPAGTTDFTGTWCPQGTSIVMQSQDRLVITITTTTVALPTAIGRNSSYPGNTACNLPLRTAPDPGTGADGSGTVQIVSPWAYSYNLSHFFYVWSQSYRSAYVNQTYANQPITYTANDLLGFRADSTHAIVLSVDGMSSSAGPSLELNTLPFTSSPYPSCLGAQYGTGHVISLEYKARSAVALSAAPNDHHALVTRDDPSSSAAPPAPPAEASTVAGLLDSARMNPSNWMAARCL